MSFGKNLEVYGMCEHCQNVKIPPLSRPLFSDRYRCPACGAEFREVVRIGKKRIGTPILVWILNLPLWSFGGLIYRLVNILPASAFVHGWKYWFYCSGTYQPFYYFYMLFAYLFLTILFCRCISHYELS